MTDSNAKEIRTGRLIAISSLVFCILLIIHHFIVLDESTAKSILSLAGQKTSDTAVKNILNSYTRKSLLIYSRYFRCKKCTCSFTNFNCSDWIYNSSNLYASCFYYT